MNDAMKSTNGSTATLKGPVSPRFFAGQLLTDRDLTALEDWARTRFRLARLRDGWGIACGLDVSAVIGAPSSLSIAPGYALDAFGNDLVLAADTKVTLCAADDRLVPPCPLPANPQGKTDAPLTFTAGPWDGLKLDSVRVFDLLLRYEPVASDPVTALVDKGKRYCDYSRTQETAKPIFVPVAWADLGLSGAAPSTPEVDLATKLLADFQGASSDVSRIRDWLKTQITNEPVLASTFPTILERLDAMSQEELGTPWGQARLLFWLVDAARRTGQTCPECCPPNDGAVALARVWAERVGNVYKIRYVDTTEDYRRLLGGGPVSDGGEAVWDHRTYLGRRWEDVKRTLGRLGVVVEREDFEYPADVEHLHDLLVEESKGETPLLAPGSHVIAVVSHRIHAPAAKPPSSPEPYAGLVVSFRRPTVLGVRPPVTSPETLYQVRAYRPGAAAPVAPSFVSTLPDEAERLTGITELPAGAFVKLVASVDQASLATTIGSVTKTFSVSFHEAIGNTIRPVSGTVPSADPIVTATIQIPDKADVRASLPVTLIVSENSTIDGRSGERRLALTDVLTAWENEQQHIPPHTSIRITNTPFKLAKTPPVLKVSPLAGKGAATTGVMLQGGDLPVNVQMNNDSPSPIKAELRFDGTSPTTATLTSAGTEIGTVQKSVSAAVADVDAGEDVVGPIVALSGTVSGANAPFFWLVNGRDAFLRTFEFSPPKSAQFSIESKNVRVEVKAKTGAGPNLHLFVTNNEADKIAISKLTIAGDSDFNKTTDVALGAASVDVAPAAEHDFGEIGSTPKICRVWMIFKIGTGSDMEGVVDVKPA